MTGQAILYQFPISHYCEKARWALDFKGLPYQPINLAPGFHLLTTRRLGWPATSVPVLQYEGETVQGSDAIIDFLDKVKPERPLTPADPATAEEARAWELQLDREIGIQLRRYMYHYLLPQSSLAKRLILHETPRSTGALFRLAFPAIRSLMRRGMNIRPETAAKSRERLEQAFARLNSRLQAHPYLAGESFSRADLSAAALLAPLCTPSEHAFPWPALEEMPPTLREFREEHRQEPFFHWTLKMYREHRG